MRLIQFIVFFGIVTVVYTLVNFYIFSRGLRTFAPGSSLRTYYTIGFWLLASTFILGRVFQTVYLSILSDVFVWAGSFWLAAMLYFFLLVFFIDILRLANHFFPFFHFLKDTFVMKSPHLLTIGLATIVFFIILAGHLNALVPRIHHLDIQTGLKATDRKELRIAMASDIHLGTIISTRRVTKMVEKINAQKPDVILLPGDIVDEDLAPVIKQNLGAILLKLEAPLGIIGSTGNHEYIGGVNPAVNYLRNHGLVILRDTMLQLTDNIYVAGREDIESNRFAGLKRKSLKEFTSNRPDSSFLIVLDHQPRAIPEAVANKANLVLSGHTHHGQLWPLNYITQAAFPVSWGHKLFDKTHVYVSSGLGSWGPPVRIGNRPEIVVITLHFDE